MTHYWRGGSFENLSELRDALKEEKPLHFYRKYLRLLEQGLRSHALSQIEDLLKELLSLPETEKRSVASLLLRATEHESGHRLLPHPLHSGFILPVLERWRAELPNDPEPLRWTNSIGDLTQALSLDPTSDYTRCKLISRILDAVGFSTHELPAGYLGDIAEDLDLIALARREMAFVVDAEKRGMYSTAIDEEAAEIAGYLERRNQTSSS